jgi:hypothetical protein
MSNSQVLDHVKSGNTLSIPTGVKPQLWVQSTGTDGPLETS